MKRKVLFFVLIIVLCVICTFALLACNKKSEENTEPALKEFSGITFSNETVSYDGNEHVIVAQGVPDFAAVQYSGNKATDTGVYNATATISADGYNTLVLNATLTINGADFTGITFSDVSVDYDGDEHSISAAGVPSFASVAYQNDKATDAGTYHATATISARGYNTLVLNATLVINKLSLTPFAFENGKFDYDGNAHAIVVTGYIPNGVTVTYSGGEDGKNGATNVGKYTINAVIGGKNYITQSLSATLEITTQEELLYTVAYQGNIYFQNALDNNKFYMIDNGDAVKINNEKPECFTVSGSNLFYLSPSLLSSGISKYDGSTTEALMDAKADTLTGDGSYLYYAVSGLFNKASNGIYRVEISKLTNNNEDAVPVKLTDANASEMVCAGNYVYFVNKDDGNKLYRIAKTAVNGTPSLVYDYKVSDMIVDNNVLYFTRHFTLSNMSAGAAIYSINTASVSSVPVSDSSASVVKITMSKGKYLAKVGNYIYFVNTDMITSTIFGEGIYKAPADGSGWIGDSYDLLSGATKVVDGTNNKIYSLSVNGGNLYYYRANTKHLYKYDGAQEIDLMEDFVPPQEQIVISTIYERMEAYNNELFYINMRDGGKLYKYNKDANASYRLTNLQVADFAIHDGWIYYAAVRLGLNFDFYKMNLITGENVLLSTDKCMHITFDGDKIYYANFSGSNTLNSMNLDGSEDTVIFDTKGVNDWNIIAYDGKVYFVANSTLYAYDIAAGTAAIVDSDAKPNEYTIIDGTIYMMNDKTSNYFSTYDIAASKLNDKIVSLGLLDDIRGIVKVGKYVYYYRNVATGSSNKGLYRVDVTATSLTAELVDECEGFYMTNSVVIGNKIYFIDAWQVSGSMPTSASTGKLCVYDLSTNEMNVVGQ